MVMRLPPPLLQQLYDHPTNESKKGSYWQVSAGKKKASKKKKARKKKKTTKKKSSRRSSSSSSSISLSHSL
eukprot:CAMPEP_0175095666 /NCGR_PEP_ID=MMETSP0086_2-20121207/4292_1 /TAXON_ID=136419 /ORGANISM="Unknown Unknown, Strain D1" /LENGTH=70 /DNA_ID=CAMNT_0016368959 /DNA_START=120 /DNA_END=333 /DNA_ORIENTATION=-